jgi:nitrilase
MPRVAIIQRAPAFLDRAGTLQIAVAAVNEAAAGGAKLIVFPEAFIPGYPAWVWRLRPGSDMALSERLHSALLRNAVGIATDDLAPLCRAAREREVTVVCGLHERDTDSSRATLYNTAVIIGSDGAILNRHRKLMPTNPERMVWGWGDGSGLKTVETPCGRLGTLICWENYMPLARYAIYARGVDVYIAPTYDTGERWVATLQHIAREGGCWVLGSGCAFRAGDLPDSFPGREVLYPDPAEWINAGDSVIVAPGGKIVAGPLRNELGILYADLDADQVSNARRSLDVVGHYSRPDIFELQVHTGAASPAEFLK